MSEIGVGRSGLSTAHDLLVTCAENIWFAFKNSHFEEPIEQTSVLSGIEGSKDISRAFLDLAKTWFRVMQTCGERDHSKVISC